VGIGTIRICFEGLSGAEGDVQAEGTRKRRVRMLRIR